MSNELNYSAQAVSCSIFPLSPCAVVCQLSRVSVAHISAELDIPLLTNFLAKTMRILCDLDLKAGDSREGVRQCDLSSTCTQTPLIGKSEAKV